MTANESITILTRLKALGYKEEDLKGKFPEDVLSLSVYDSSFSRFLQDNAGKLEADAGALSPNPRVGQQESAPGNNEVVKIKLDFNFAKLKHIIFFLAIVTGVAGGMLSIYTYNKFASPNTLGVSIAGIKDKPSAEEIKAIVSKMSQIMVLPKDELPEVLVISDLTQLRANPFFESANLGDYIVIYKKAGKVFLYNPSSNRIVNTGPYSAEADKPHSPSPTPAGQTEPSPTPEPEASDSAGTP